jgi:hypothetical protein
MANPRTQGHNWEREVLDDLSTLLDLQKRKEIGTSREFSRALDALGIDIWFEDSSNPISLQCKKTMNRAKTTKNIDVSSLDRINRGVPVLATKVTEKVNVREKTVGKYITFDYNTGLKLLKLLIQHAELFRDKGTELQHDSQPNERDRGI